MRLKIISHKWKLLFIRVNIIAKRVLAPFSEQQHTFRHPAPKIAENFFGKPFGSPMTKNTLFLVFFPFWGGPGGHFSKNPKFFVFQILNFPDPISRLPLDLESSNFFWYALTWCWTDCSIPHWLVWFGLVWTGMWCQFWKNAVLKIPVRKFLIFLA